MNFRAVPDSHPSSYPSSGLVCSGTTWQAHVLMRRFQAGWSDGKPITQLNATRRLA